MKNTLKKQSALGLLMTVAAVGLLNSCGPSAADLQQIKAEEDSARVDAQNERRGREEAEQKTKSLEREIKQLKEQVDGIKQDRDKLEDAMKKLDKEFTDYKGKYKAAILQKVPGLTIKPLIYDKKSYDNLVVRNIDGDALILSHPNGLLHLRASDLPTETRAFLALDQKTEYHDKVAAFLKEFDKHKSLEDGRIPTEEKPKSKIASGPAKPDPPEARPNAFDLELMKFVAQVTVNTEKGETGSASGFIARQGNATYFYTSAHVVTGISTISTVTSDGRRFQLPDALEMSDEDEAFDVVRFKLSSANVPGLDLAESPTDVKVGDKVIAMGDSGGAGVIPVLEGKVQALGAFWIEADAPTIKGNSGGPLMLDGTTKVVGIVTHYMNPYGSMGATPFNGIRRLCLRPDQISRWRASSLTRLAREPKSLDQIETDNSVLQSVSNVTFSQSGIMGIAEDALLAGGRSQMGTTIANAMRTVNAFFQRSKPTVASGRGHGAAIAAPTIREQCSTFVTAVLQVYGAGVAGVDENSYSRFTRARFHQLAEQRKSICIGLRSHLEGEITRIDPYTAK